MRGSKKLLHEGRGWRVGIVFCELVQGKATVLDTDGYWYVFCKLPASLRSFVAS